MITFLRRLFRCKFHFTFILHSGVEIEFTCEEFELTRQANELTGYKATGGTANQLRYVRLSEIAAILRR